MQWFSIELVLIEFKRNLSLSDVHTPSLLHFSRFFLKPDALHSSVLYFYKSRFAVIFEFPENFCFR